jgi:hypothetical protein
LSLKFLKSDVAKYINLWDQEPHEVSLGSQKSFIHFMKKVTGLVSKGKMPGENFYKKLVGNAILYRTVDKLFGRKNYDAIGDTNLKSFTVTYTISYFNFLTENRLDLWRIYEQQKLDDDILIVLKELLLYIYNFLIKGANNTLLSEHAKRHSTWVSVKEGQYHFDLDRVSAYLITKVQAIEREKENEVDTADVEKELFTISKITTLGLKFWDGMRIYIIQTRKYSDIEFEVWDLVKSIQNQKNIDAKCIRAGKRVLELIQLREIHPEYIKSLSSIEEEKAIDLKAIYDRMKLLSKEDWARAVALSNKTSLFSNLELANVKSVQRSLLSNEKVKAPSLIKAHESLEKLKKFGIKY